MKWNVEETRRDSSETLFIYVFCLGIDIKV